MVRCPFFRGHCHSPTVEIGCEGITDNTTLRLVFQTRAERDAHESIFCANKYHYCELYRAIYEKYDE